MYAEFSIDKNKNIEKLLQIKALEYLLLLYKQNMNLYGLYTLFVLV